MNDQPRNDQPFDIRNHMPAGAKLDDPYNHLSAATPTGYVGGTTSTLTVPPRTPWYRKPVTAIAAGVGIVALCSGIALGGLANQTPKECEQALGYAEQAIGYSATGMGAAADGATGGLYARMQATDELNQVAADLKRITPLYQSAKAACLK